MCVCVTLSLSQVSISESAVKEATAKRGHIDGVKQELAAISEKLLVEAEAESKAREEVQQLERRLAAARAALQTQVSFNASLQRIAKTVEDKVEQQESELGETVAEAAQALAGAKRDVSLLTALQRFVDAVGAPLLSQRIAGLATQLSDSLEQLRELRDEAVATVKHARLLGFFEPAASGGANTSQPARALGRVARQFFVDSGLRIVRLTSTFSLATHFPIQI